MLRNEVGQQPEHRRIDQREQPADKPEAPFRLHRDCVHNCLNGITGVIKGNILCVLIFAAVFLPQPAERITVADLFHNLRVVRQDHAAAAFLRRPFQIINTNWIAGGGFNFNSAELVVLRHNALEAYVFLFLPTIGGQSGIFLAQHRAGGTIRGVCIHAEHTARYHGKRIAAKKRTC